MAGGIRGIRILLHARAQTGVDALNRPVYADDPVYVDDVLVAPLSSQEQAETLDLTGKKVVYNLAIPKGDEHEWENTTVEFFGKTWEVVNYVTEGIEENIPLRWNKKVQVARSE